MSQTSEITLADGKILVQKVGSVVTVIGGLTGHKLTTAWQTVATLPEGWRPAAQISDEAYSNGTSTSYSIMPSGDINVIRVTSATSMVRFCCTYIAA